MGLYLNFLRSKEKEELLKLLNEQFGIKKLDYTLVMSGKEKIRGFSGDLNKEDILRINELANIEVIGLYLLKEEHGYRLSFDATILLSNQINKNLLDITEEQYKLWMTGQDLDIQTPPGTKVISFKGNFLGCGKSNGEKLFNYVPKDRRLRK